MSLFFDIAVCESASFRFQKIRFHLMAVRASETKHRRSLRGSNHEAKIAFILFSFNNITNLEICYLKTGCYCWIEKGAFAPKASPMESCRPAIIVSFGVTAHCGPHGLR